MTLPDKGAEALRFENAMRQLTRVDVAQYLLSNTRARSNGALKATAHASLTVSYVAVVRGVDPDRVRRRCEADYQVVHDSTAEHLTSKLDRVIGFDLDGYVDDDVAERFFKAFHSIALAALAPAPAQGAEAGAGAWYPEWKRMGSDVDGDPIRLETTWGKFTARAVKSRTDGKWSGSGNYGDGKFGFEHEKDVCAWLEDRMRQRVAAELTRATEAIALYATPPAAPEVGEIGALVERLDAGIEGGVSANKIAKESATALTALSAKLAEVEREKGAVIARCRVAEADAELWQIQVDKTNAEIADLRRKLEEAREDITRGIDQEQLLQSRILRETEARETAERKLEEATKALEPFAKYGRVALSAVNIRDDRVEIGIYSDEDAEVTAGDFRRARALASDGGSNG
ncbi:hypothetical protein [Mesorhizobium sp. B2-3-4]|uniref:hypothetical protein n=1 Tax=Mesorhizobium sp. B2-3-4 TaxID=2589959 RepID=UPI001125DD93|nr:hypothetical protein [Mesorhizobium sp. B2-3-4]TPM39626.1 hypothetical protein FJ967_09095 [Mesorhizobium sp. B2-3-4]